MDSACTAPAACRYDPRDDVTAATIARAQGRLLPPSSALVRVERFALAGAVIYKTTKNWTTGSGRGAQIDPKWLHGKPPAGDNPFDVLSSTLRGSYYEASQATEKSRRTHVAHFLGQYTDLGLESMAVTENFIRIGGGMPLEIAHYTQTSARVLSETELTRPFDEARRVAVAHQLSPLITRRASLHLAHFTVAGGWERIEQAEPYISEMQPTRTKPGETTTPPDEIIYELLGAGGVELLPVALRIWEQAAMPLLKCPAHQRIHGSESALQTQIHAGINLAGQRGLYDPQLTVPPIYAQP